MKLYGKITALALLVGAFSLIAASCNHNDDSSSSGTTTTAARTTTTAASPATDIEFELATILPESGDLAFLGPPMIQAARLAVQEINDASAGIEIIFLPGDSGTMPAIAGAVADAHIADNVSGILGAAASGISLSIIDKVTQAGIVMISPSNTSPTFTGYDDGGYYFRTAPSDILQGRLLAETLVDDGHSSAVVLNRADDYGRQLAAATKDALESAGGSATVIEFDPEAASFEGEAQRVAASNADAVVVIAFEEGVKVLSALFENNVAANKMYITDGLAVADLGERINPQNTGVVAGITGVAPSAAPESGEATFESRFRAFAPEVESLIFSSASYDAVVILALAALEAKSAKSSDYVGFINNITKGGEKCNRFAACAALINAGTNIDYDGASGPLEFTDPGEPGAGVYDIFAFSSTGERSVSKQETLS